MITVTEFQTGFAGGFEFVAWVPGDGVGEVMTCQPRSMPKRMSLALPVKSQSGRIVVGEVVVIVFGEVFVLLLPHACVVAFEEVPVFNGEGGDADAGEGEVVGAIVAAGLGSGVGDDGEVEALGGGFDVG